MRMGGHREHVIAHPLRTLITAFAAWKLIIFAIAAGSCVGDAYDTSGALVVLGSSSNNHTSPSRSLLGKLASRFASWDAIYYVSTARRGYRFEQEWAFGTALPITIRAITTALDSLSLGFIIEGEGSSPGPSLDDAQGSALPETLVGILVANAFHLLSVVVLFRLSLLVWRNHPQRVLASLLSAALHVVSPAGLFLSSPFAESSCALFSFIGYLLYARSCLSAKPISQDGFLVLAGSSFGIATAFRSNGILNGIPFAWEVLQVLPRLAADLISTSGSGRGQMRTRQKGPRSTVNAVRRLLALGVGGLAVAAGSLVPQAVAYQRFCSGASGSTEMPRRPWCQGYVPSIYTFVQRHYWDVGFLRYWKLSNVPLFLLAAPMLAIMVRSAAETLVSGTTKTQAKPPAGDKDSTTVDSEPARLTTLVRSAAAAQLLLAVLAVTNYHVQIITRISSAYPLWYWWLAGKLVRGEAWGSRIVTFMVMYASIQGALFTSFLPPA
ncbi:hypothetical protein B0T16DRAFT_205763 [Cercophora newfieldiana]|uniref:GPI mannosyltransferase 2 n=1 Tax=Cercophora newfieldiana TaxID=92897 RepID=A0AA39XVF4_9PEZI|nr:hypothetical protein B0T16DRAFT_205763 [Cercophora newfieldiana]